MKGLYAFRYFDEIDMVGVEVGLGCDVKTRFIDFLGSKNHMIGIVRERGYLPEFVSPENYRFGFGEVLEWAGDNHFRAVFAPEPYAGSYVSASLLVCFNYSLNYLLMDDGLLKVQPVRPELCHCEGTDGYSLHGHFSADFTDWLIEKYEIGQGMPEVADAMLKVRMAINGGDDRKDCIRANMIDIGRFEWHNNRDCCCFGIRQGGFEKGKVSSASGHNVQWVWSQLAFLAGMGVLFEQYNKDTGNDDTG